MVAGQVAAPTSQQPWEQQTNTSDSGFEMPQSENIVSVGLEHDPAVDAASAKAAPTALSCRLE